MQFTSIITAFALASVAVADQVLTQIGDGQIQAPTTENQETVATSTTETPKTSTTEAPKTSTTEAPTTTEAPKTSTISSTTETATEFITITSSSTYANTTLSQFENGAPRAVIGGGLAAIAGLAVLL